MSTRTYFFPPPPEPFPADMFVAESEELRRLYQVMNDLARRFCPVCKVFAKEDEIHITDGRTCNKIVNFSVS